MAIAITPGIDADLNGILALLKENALPIAGIEQHIATSLVARENETIIGCAAIEMYGNVGLLRSVAVAARLRGTGLGQRLTDGALELGRRGGVRTVYLLTTTAERFFPRFGFTPIARSEMDPALSSSEELRGACPETAIAMRKKLGP